MYGTTTHPHGRRGSERGVHVPFWFKRVCLFLFLSMGTDACASPHFGTFGAHAMQDGEHESVVKAEVVPDTLDVGAVDLSRSSPTRTSTRSASGWSSWVC